MSDPICHVCEKPIPYDHDGYNRRECEECKKTVHVGCWHPGVRVCVACENAPLIVEIYCDDYAWIYLDGALWRADHSGLSGTAHDLISAAFGAETIKSYDTSALEREHEDSWLWDFEAKAPTLEKALAYLGITEADLHD